MLVPDTFCETKWRRKVSQTPFLHDETAVEERDARGFRSSMSTSSSSSFSSLSSNGIEGMPESKRHHRESAQTQRGSRSNIGRKARRRTLHAHTRRRCPVAHLLKDARLDLVEVLWRVEVLLVRRRHVELVVRTKVGEVLVHRQFCTAMGDEGQNGQASKRREEEGKTHSIPARHPQPNPSRSTTRGRRSSLTKEKYSTVRNPFFPDVEQ